MTVSSAAIKNWIGLITHPSMSYSDQFLCVLYHYPEHKIDRIIVSNLSTWTRGSIQSFRSIDTILAEMRARDLIKQVNLSSATEDPQIYTVSLKLTPYGIKTARKCVDLYNIVIPDGYSNPMIEPNSIHSNYTTEVSNQSIAGLSIKIIVSEHANTLEMKYDISLPKCECTRRGMRALVELYTQKILHQPEVICEDFATKDKFHVITAKNILSLTIQALYRS